MSIKAWVATAAKQKMVLQDIDLGPLGTEDVEVAVEHCGLCHSDVSVLNNDWGISAIPGHPRPRGRWPRNGGRHGDQGSEGRPAGRSWLDRRELHALPAMHVRRPAPVRPGPADDSRPPRRLRLARALPLGVGRSAAGGIEVRRGRSALVRGHHRLPPARPVRQADQPRWGRRHRRARAHGGQVRGCLRVRRDGIHFQREQVRRSSRVRSETRRLQSGLRGHQEAWQARSTFSS